MKDPQKILGDIADAIRPYFLGITTEKEKIIYKGVFSLSVTAKNCTSKNCRYQILTLVLRVKDQNLCAMLSEACSDYFCEEPFKTVSVYKDYPELKHRQLFWRLVEKIPEPIGFSSDKSETSRSIGIGNLTPAPEANFF